jgi:TonB-linked SusC/RagA family outer membrane protein
MKCFLTVAKKTMQSKVLLVMKLTTLLILIFTLNVAATGFGQEKINLRVKKAEIGDVLRSIEKQTSYRFLYNNKLEDIREKVSINVKEAGIADVLRLLLEKTRLLYQVTESNLIIIKEDPNAPPRVPDVTIRGKITGEGGVPLSGVSIVVKGTTAGTTTNNDGEFSLTIPDANVTLVITSVGYDMQEIVLGGKTEVTISLVTSDKVMEQVVVVGYGSQRKLDVTGSVSQVKGEDISKQSSVNPISALQGKVAGVQITNSGAPGSSPQIRIRGLGTVYGNPNPLYVVDGVWFDDISFLNPADIENISILKDASSQSIYGIRAANGVVLISTKKGRNGRAIVNYNGFVGYQTVTNQVKMANANEYAILINELDGTQVLNPADYGEGTDWYGQILRNALITNHQISLSGGSDRNTYNFSLGYLKQDGIVESNSYERYTARLQNDFTISKAIKVGYTVTAAGSNSEDIDGSIFRQMYAAYPVLPVYYADGSYGDPGDYPLGDGAKFNPQATLDVFDQQSKNYRLTGSVYADIKFAKHFTFHTSVGGEYGQGEVRNYLPVYTATLNQRNTISRLTMSRAETRNWILENTLLYDTKIGDHGVKVLIGQSAQRYQSYGFTASAQNVPNTSDGDRYLALGTVGTRNVSDNGGISTIASYFARLNYSYKNKYLLTASVRADGSSKFFGDDRWGYFPSIGAGWVISEESFMKDQNIFSSLKLRGSWGKIGNASVPSNISVLRVTQKDNYAAIVGGVPQTGASIDMVVPPTTVWERGVGTDIGIEASVMKNKLYLEADYYIKKTEQAIFDIPIPGSVGTSSGTILGNQADFENRGFEFTATWKDNMSKDLSYSISGNIGFNKNKVLSVVTGGNPIYGGGNAATSGALSTRTIAGQPIGQFFGLVIGGIFQNAGEITGSAQPAARPGDFRYIDQNKDGIINDKDRVPIGNPNPKVSYGLNTNWTYKQFDLTLDFQGVAGVEVYNANLGLRFGRENYTKDFYDNRWHGQGTSNEYPSAKIGGGDNYKPNTFFVESGSYFRVRNMQLGYTVSSMLTDKWHVSKLRVFVNAQNALNFFKYRGFSPEVGGGTTSAGIDANVYPLSATYNFGVNVTF